MSAGQSVFVKAFLNNVQVIAGGRNEWSAKIVPDFIRENIVGFSIACEALSNHPVVNARGAFLRIQSFPAPFRDPEYDSGNDAPYCGSDVEHAAAARARIVGVLYASIRQPRRKERTDRLGIESCTLTPTVPVARVQV